MKKFALFAILATALALIVAACGIRRLPPHHRRPPHQPRHPPPQQLRHPPPQQLRHPLPQRLRHPLPQRLRHPPPQRLRHPPPQRPVPKSCALVTKLYPDIIDPQKSSFAVEINVMQMAYEGLTRQDDKGNIVPAQQIRGNRQPMVRK